MNRSTDPLFDRRIADWLEEDPNHAPDQALETILAAVPSISQRRRLPVPWRFNPMPTPLRLAAAAVIGVVALGVIYLNLPGRDDVGGEPTSTPTPTVAPTVAITPQPTFDPTDPSAWTTYTSAVYGFTMAYPSDWSVYGPADHKWTPDEPAPNDAWPYADVFANNEEVDGDSIGMWVFQIPAPTGSDLASWEGLEAVVLDTCEGPGLQCPSAAPPTPMCLGQQECQPAIIVSVSYEQTPSAYFGDPETGVVTVFAMGRPDDFPAAARYKGTVALLKAILAQVDVREPQPGETPR